VSDILIPSTPEAGGNQGDYLQACRRVLAAGVLARDRAELLAIEPGRWPRGAVHLRERIAGPGSGGSPGAELDLIDSGHDLQGGLAETVEDVVGADPRLADALLRLQLDCARVRFVFEETSMRLRGDPLRFAHAAAHGRLLRRLNDARTSLRAGRADEVRARVAAFRAELADHVRETDGGSGTRTGGSA
jgi:hemerythrin